MSVFMHLIGTTEDDVDINDTNDNPADHDQADLIDDITDSHLGLPNQTRECAKFLLHITEEHHLTHSGVNNLCGSVQWLVESLFSQVTDKLKLLIPETVDQTQREAILETCNPCDLFSELNSRYLREKYYKNHFNYVVWFTLGLLYYTCCINCSYIASCMHAWLQTVMFYRSLHLY